MAKLNTIFKIFNYIILIILRTKILSDKNGNWLLIESSKVEDEGIYTCQFSAVQPRVSYIYSYHLVVLEACAHLKHIYSLVSDYTSS